MVSVLQMLERALSLERALVTAAASAERAVPILGLSKLMLGNVLIVSVYTSNYVHSLD